MDQAATALATKGLSTPNDLKQDNTNSRTLSSFFSSFDVSSPAQQAAKDAVMGWCSDAIEGNPSGLVLYSKGYGVGKTHLARCADSALMWGGRRGYFFSTPDWLMALRESYNSNTNESYLFRGWGKGFFILDDFGKEYLKDGTGGWAHEKFYMLLDKMQGKQLLVTSNLTPTEMAKRLGGAAWSRLGGLCGERFVNMSSLPDYRLKRIA
jgi:DNA replication protein DnaC